MMMLFAENANAGSMEMIFTIGSLAMLGVVFYFFIYRPQKKQEKEATDMRNAIELGDVIVTTGGIMGMVVKVKDEMLLIETGGDRTKIQIQKWAVHSILEKANAPVVNEEEKKETKKTKKKK